MAEEALSRFSDTGALVVDRNLAEKFLAQHIQQGRFLRSPTAWFCRLYVDGIVQSYGRFHGYLDGDEFGLTESGDDGFTQERGGNVMRFYRVTALGIAKFFYDCVEHDDCFVNPALGRACRMRALNRASAALPETLP